MKVHLKRNFNAPGDHLFFMRNSPVEMDDDLLPYLPSDSRVDGETRNETRLKVLQARKKLGLDDPNPRANEIDSTGKMLTDEQLLAGEKSRTDKEDKADAKLAPVTKATLQAGLKTAEENLKNAQKKLANAKTEPEKGVAKADIAMAEKGMNEAEGALLAFEDEQHGN